jgi:hypothetical protein
MTEPSRLKLGRLPNDPAKPRLRLRLTPGAAPVVPAVADWMSRVVDWPMYANDRYGDCVFAMIGHTIQALSTYGQGTTATITDADVLAAYSAVTGFDPDDPSTDQGTVIQDALDYWRKHGIGGHKILAFAQIDHTDPTQVDAAVAQFGAVLLGINFPASAMEQFDAGQPWDVVRSDGGIEGGHAIPGGAYTATDGRVRIVTWARSVEMTAAFARRYVEEAWVVIAPEWLSAAGADPAGVDLAGLGAQFSALTGEPSPFGPTPGPAPDPGPPPFSSGSILARLWRWLRGLLGWGSRRSDG